MEYDLKTLLSMADSFGEQFRETVQQPGKMVEVEQVNTAGATVTTVSVADEPNKVWVQLYDETTRPVKVYNVRVQPKANVPVWVFRRKDGSLEVWGVRAADATELYGTAASSINTPITQGDAINQTVASRALMMGRLTWVSGLTVRINEFFYPGGYFPGDTIDLTGDLPGTANRQAWVVIYLDPATNTLAATTGTEYPFSYAPMLRSDLGDVATPANTIRLWGLVLTDSDTAISDSTVIVDCRNWLEPDIIGTVLTHPITFTDGSELTIAAGVVTVTLDYHTIDTQADAATDDLDTINGGAAGQELVIRASNAARTVVVKHGTGNIKLSGGSDYSMDTATMVLKLFYNGSDWVDEGLPATSSGGATAVAEYVTTASDGTLTSEVVIPGLAGSPDIASAAGGGINEEYDSATTGLTWNIAPAAENSDTTKSHLYFSIASASEHIGSRAWAPSAAFDARTKISLGTDTTTGNSHSVGLHIGDSGDANRLLAVIERTSTSYTVRALTYAAGAYTARGSTWTIGTNEIYLRIVRDGSNNNSFYWSVNGLAWQLIATQALTLTVSNIGYRADSDITTAYYCYSDWLRTSV